MNTATMKCWSVTSDQNGFMPQEIVRCKLQGYIYDDSAGRFPDGYSIHTSTILAITDHGAYKVVETKNTEYTVCPADVDPEYEAQFPGAYERLSDGRVKE